MTDPSRSGILICTIHVPCNTFPLMICCSVVLELLPAGRPRRTAPQLEPRAAGWVLRHLLIGQDEKGGVLQLLLRDQLHQLTVGLRQPLPVCRVHHVNDRLNTFQYCQSTNTEDDKAA
jgi:hypothetical protein